MGGSDVRQRADGSFHAGWAALTLPCRSPLHFYWPGMVRRSPLIERLANGDCHSIVSVVAPTGYGKATLLWPWAERNSQAFARVPTEETDNDLKVLPGRVLSGAVPDQASVPVVAEPLTQREQQVLRHVSAMLSTAGAASQRYMSNNTVKAHLNSIYRKLAATHRGEAVRKALQLALI